MHYAATNSCHTIKTVKFDPMVTIIVPNIPKFNKFLHNSQSFKNIIPTI